MGKWDEGARAGVSFFFSLSFFFSFFLSFSPSLGVDPPNDCGEVESLSDLGGSAFITLKRE
jgi:hypothetical protein